MRFFISSNGITIFVHVQYHLDNVFTVEIQRRDVHRVPHEFERVVQFRNVDIQPFQDVVDDAMTLA